MVQNKTYFPNLDGLRSLAFLAVFLGHCFSANTVLVKQSDAYQWAISFFRLGGLGVSFFFVLSGFLITFLLLEEEKINGRIKVALFHMRRILRIWPLYFACILFGFLVYPWILQSLLNVSFIEPATFSWYLFFIGNFDVINNGWPNTPTVKVLWSICVQEQFYLVWAFLLFWVKSWRKAIMIGIIIISLLFRIYYSRSEDVLYLHTISIISDMGVGGLLALLTYLSPLFLNKLNHIKTYQIAVVYALGLIWFIFHKWWGVPVWLIPWVRLIYSFFFV
ncbi:MAG: acyltransferase, partial [Tunicatimonas sp.]|uniref:acyltransferase family protein n=1 Tax=Tunicatimonas sp. TaxID=1940096 RepID=UPI003C724EFA